MQRILSLTATAAVALLFCTSALAGGTADHLECYKVKDPHKFKATVDIVPTFEAEVFGIVAHQDCRISVRSKELCVPVQKTNVTTDAPAVPVTGPELTAGFLCYKMKCPFEATTAALAGDQFGIREVQPSKVSRICAPADW